MSIEVRCFPVSLLLPVIILCSQDRAIANDNVQACSSSSPPAAEARRGRSVVLADHAAGGEVEEQEGVDDPDLIMHMQMKLRVDIPPEDQAAPASVAKAASQATSASVASPHEEAKREPPASPGAAPRALSPARPAAEGPSAPAAAAAARPAPLSKMLPASASPSPYNSLLLGALIGASLVLAGVLLALLVRSLLAARRAKTQADLKAAGKAWLLDWALGFDPDTEVAGALGFEPVQVEAELKVPCKKKPPPAAAASDTDDTDEAEPEAESESEMLQDAVFQAEQVEVANESVDLGYGESQDRRLVDQIRCEWERI